MTSAKVLTIIIPTFNMEKYLHKCLLSLVLDDASLMDVLEVIVVNDGSTDSSSRIAHSYAEQYPGTFRVIDKANGHYGSCINAALPVANGKYVKILDADDFFDTHSFSNYISALSSIDADLVLNDLVTVNESYLIKDEICLSIPSNKVLLFEDVAPLYDSFYMHEVCYRKDILCSISYMQTEGVPYTDIEWVIKPISAISSVYYLPLKVYHYLQGREGQSIDKNNRSKSLGVISTLLLSLVHYWRTNKYGQPYHQTATYNCILKQFWNTYYSFFVFHYYRNQDFREFDSMVTKMAPEFIPSINNFWWINCRLLMHPVKNWRERHWVSHYVSDFSIWLYRILRPAAFK